MNDWRLWIPSRDFGLVSLLCIPIANSAFGQVSATDKSQYHLFNPTPRELMRGLSPDRPDVTESALTVDAGHVQLEMSFIDYSRDGNSNAYLVAPFNLKLGLTNNIDFQIGFDPYLRVEEDDGHVSGAGDTVLRLKMNLFGNDRGGDRGGAMALMPFIKLPTAADEIGNDRVEGGLILAFQIDLVNEWTLALMAEFDAVYVDDRDQYGLEFVHTAALGHDIIGPLGGFLEYVGVAGVETGSSYSAQLGGGLTYLVSPDLQFDAGVYFGLTGAVSDVNLLAGMTVRF